MNKQQAFWLLIYMLAVCSFVALISYHSGVKAGAQRERTLHHEFKKFMDTDLPQPPQAPAEKDNGFWI